MTTKYDYNDPNAPLPEFSLENTFSLLKDPQNLYAPEFWRRWIAGDSKDKQIWATKSWQGLNYAALLAAIGYGSRKLLRGASPEAQEAFNAIDKYLPGNDGNPYLDESRLVDKNKYVSNKDKFKQAIQRVFSAKESSEDVNSLAYIIPPGAAVMGWIIGQKLAEKEVENYELSDSKAALAKARSDYDRTLAMKLNPGRKIQEKVVADRVQNPLDWGIEKAIQGKNALASRMHDALFTEKRAQDPAGDQIRHVAVRDSAEAQREAIEKQFGESPGLAATAQKVVDWSGATPYLVMAAALTFLGAGKYAWNNQRAEDKNIQKALDREAAIKRRALEMRDQTLDISRFSPPQRKRPATASV